MRGTYHSDAVGLGEQLGAGEVDGVGGGEVLQEAVPAVEGTGNGGEREDVFRVPTFCCDGLRAQSAQPRGCRWRHPSGCVDSRALSW